MNGKMINPRAFFENWQADIDQMCVTSITREDIEAAETVHERMRESFFRD